MIKGIILDVDGVLVGDKTGFNFPDPHPEVIASLKTIEASGVQISLCTAKPHLAITSIITLANLRNPHISNGGSVIIDPVDNDVVKSHLIDNDVATEIVRSCLSHNFYTEVYSLQEYFIQESQQAAITDVHSAILRQAPKLVESLEKVAETDSIAKLTLITSANPRHARNN